MVLIWVTWRSKSLRIVAFRAQYSFDPRVRYWSICPSCISCFCCLTQETRTWRKGDILPRRHHQSISRSRVGRISFGTSDVHIYVVRCHGDLWKKWKCWLAGGEVSQWWFRFITAGSMSNTFQSTWNITSAVVQTVPDRSGNLPSPTNVHVNAIIKGWAWTRDGIHWLTWEVTSSTQSADYFRNHITSAANESCGWFQKVGSLDRLNWTRVERPIQKPTNTGLRNEGLTCSKREPRQTRSEGFLLLFQLQPVN